MAEDFYSKESLEHCDIDSETFSSFVRQKSVCKETKIFRILDYGIEQPDKRNFFHLEIFYHIETTEHKYMVFVVCAIKITDDCGLRA